MATSRVLSHACEEPRRGVSQSASPRISACCSFLLVLLGLDRMPKYLGVGVAGPKSGVVPSPPGLSPATGGNGWSGGGGGQWQLQEQIVGWSYLTPQIITMLQIQVKYFKNSKNIIEM